MAVRKSQAEITTAVVKSYSAAVQGATTGKPSLLGPSLSALTPQKPLNEFGQAFAQLRCRTVAKQFSRFRNVRICTRHIARLFREAIDFCFFADGIFDRQNEIFQLNRLTLTEIKDVKQWAYVVERGHGPLNDIIDVGVIALRAAISKLIDRLAGVNAAAELMNRQIGTLPRAVNSEIPQSYDPHLVKVRIRRAKKFACNFRGAVGAKRLREMFLLGKWDRL